LSGFDFLEKGLSFWVQKEILAAGSVDLDSPRGINDTISNP